MQNIQEAGKKFTLRDYVNVFFENKKKILLISLSAGIIMAIIAFFIMDLIFLSTGTVKTTSKSSGLGGLLGASGLPDLSDFGEIAGSSGSKAEELALYENILNSRRCIEEVIVKFNLMEEYNYKTMFDALKYFREQIMEIRKDKLSGTMDIGIYDKNPQRAKEIVEFLIFQLNKINTELNIQNARNNRVFIQERYDEAKNQLTMKEDSLRDFQNQYGISPDIQIQAAVKADIELETQIKSEEVKLEILEKIISPNESEVKIQKERINALEEQLNKIKNTSTGESNLALKGSPDVIMTFLRLKREVEIQNKILTTLIPLLEQSKIDEKKETPTVLVLDNPNVPDKKVKPKRLTLTLIAFTLTFLAAYAYFFLKTQFFRKQ